MEIIVEIKAQFPGEVVFSPLPKSKKNPDGRPYGLINFVGGKMLVENDRNRPAMVCKGVICSAELFMDHISPRQILEMVPFETVNPPQAAAKK